MLKVEKKYLLIIAGLFWFIAGFNIIKIGLESSNGKWTWYMIILAMVVYFLFNKMVFSKMVKKHTKRIISYEDKKQNIFRFFNKQAYLIMGFMITFGIGLRVSGLCPDVFIAVFYTGLGTALVKSGINFDFEYIKYNKSIGILNDQVR